MDRPLRICLLSYRSNPHCGGQGVYLKQLSRSLADLGHHVEVLSGPPDPQLDGDIPVHRVPSLDLYDPADPFRLPRPAELTSLPNVYEWLNVSTMGFPEPFLFGLRAYQFLQRNGHRYDVIHDNQSLSYGLWALSRRLPTLATIHHPITVDLDIAIRAERYFWRKLKQLRWYSFIHMQKQVARTLPYILTVSECARRDISRDFTIPLKRFRIVPNGINTDLFYPLPDVQRDSHRIIVTNSADTPLKGLVYLLHAIAEIRRRRPVRLVVIGQPKPNGTIERLVRKLNLADQVSFTGRISSAAFVREYARAGMAVVPSVYEGFGLPAGEAMACGVPVIATTGGALPEVVGDAGILVPPRDTPALAAAIEDLLDDPAKAVALGQRGYQRVQAHFTWQRAAEKTVAAYREVIHDYRRS
ncbi:MAG: glycosyltransferase family 4 protein [Desulfobacteraceae bacterium]|nr:glycosyltransferase family 4 protein [Desulfobacteraceae bacterium]MBC2752295.1 glycosyltransferase family 4 protein [Desulfobacteraceae bacterium]